MFGSNEEQLRIGISTTQGIGYCYCGKDVAATATSADDCFHVVGVLMGCVLGLTGSPSWGEEAAARAA